MSSISDWLAALPAAAVYAVVAALVFCEDAIFVGFVLPAESAVIIGGVLAGQGRVSVYWLAAAVVVSAILGDSVGYEIGHRFGPRILEIRALKNHQDRIGQARGMIRRRGAAAVFIGRFLAFFRAMMPALAGVSHLPYRTFLLFNALGGLVWGVGFTLLGYYAGAAYGRIEHTVGRAVAITVAGLVVALLIGRHVRRRRGARAHPAARPTAMKDRAARGSDKDAPPPGEDSGEEVSGRPGDE
ncbi:DedA family protein [Streptomyces sp. NPDC006923]|uniref:DedA family protein n=1 Tax=Streptomyces sp. NPDC006923 TaxID=3155355 RepID=UPI0033F00A84